MTRYFFVKVISTMVTIIICILFVSAHTLAAEPLFTVDFPTYFSETVLGENTATVTKNCIEDGVTCVKVVPNPEYNGTNNNDIILDTYINIKTNPNGFATGIDFAKAKYVAVKYKYICPEDTVGSAKEMRFGIMRNGSILASSAYVNAINAPIKNKWSYAYFDISAVAVNANEDGILRQIHIVPFGQGVKPNKTVSGEVFYISEVMFYDQDPTVTEQFNIRIDNNINNGSVNTDKEKAAAGDNITITVKAADGYKVASVTYNDGEKDIRITASNGVYSFVMPAADVTVSAEFIPVQNTGAVTQVTEKGSKIPNTYARMKNGENVNLGYFGGSVTNGYAAANPPYNDKAPTQGVNCWRGLSKSWLQSEYGVPNGMTFAERNSNGSVSHAGLGGTGIDLNLFRADRFLGLSSGDPVDLVFVEFSINDSYENNSYEKSAFYMESCIKMIREKSPTTDIVIILTTDHTKLSESKGGTVLHKNAQAHIDVAEYYGIPWFWFGEYMYDFLCEQNGGAFPGSGSDVWKTYMADGCHPSIQGYNKYFEFLRDYFLIPNLDDTKGFTTNVVEYTTPEVPYNATDKFLSQNVAFEGDIPSIYHKLSLRSDAYMISPSQVENFGEKGYGYEIYAPNGSIYSNGGYMTTSVAGMSFTVKFKSKNAGMFYKGHPTMGLIRYRVDGGEWQDHNMYKSANNQHEYFMFYENSEETEHTVDVILRKTSNGSDFEFRGFFVEGDSTKYGAKLLEGAPNNAPLNEFVGVPKVLSPSVLNTVIQGGNYINDGSTFDVYHLGVIDKDVLRYVPNPESAERVASDCFNSVLREVVLPRYKYAVVNYYYELEPGTTENNATGARQRFDFYQKRNSSDSNHKQTIESADTIVLGGTTANQSLFDITALCVRNDIYEGYINQFHFYPYGYFKGSDLASTELMNIESVTFYEEYPYKDEYVIEVPVDKSVAEEIKIDLNGKKILPSAHIYATVKYRASEDSNVTLSFNGLYGGDYSVSKELPAEQEQIIIILDEIAESGQTFYYEDVVLSSDKEIEVESITFSVKYPDPDAQFPINFEANGGTGDVPTSMTGKLGTIVSLPSANLEKGAQLFLGWSTEKDGSDVIAEVEIPVGGITLYAVYADVAYLNYSANGGKGVVPSPVRVFVGKQIVPESADLTKENAVFIGWGLSPNATVPVDSITMDNDGVTVYAIFVDNTNPIFTVDFPSYFSEIVLGEDTAYVTKDYIEEGVTCLKVVPNRNYNSTQNSDIILDTYINIKTYPNGFAAGELFSKAKYMAVKYKYVCPDGIEGSAKEMRISITRNGGILTSSAYLNAINEPIKNEWTYAYFDISDVAANAHADGIFRQIHITPFGQGIKSNQTSEGEIFYIADVQFYAQELTSSTEYDVTIDPDMRNGTVSVDKESAKSGDVVCLTISPDAGFEIDSVKYNDGVSDVSITASEGIYSFIMPASPVKIFVTFKEQTILHNVVVKLTRENGIKPLYITFDDGTTYSSSGKIIIEKDGTEVYSGSEDADNDISEIKVNVELQTGKYIIKIMKPGYLTYIGDIEVSADGVNSINAELIPGDIRDSYDTLYGDGVINLDDFIRVLRGFSTDSNEKMRYSVDVNEDGCVNVGDLAIIKANFGKNNN